MQYNAREWLFTTYMYINSVSEIHVIFVIFKNSSTATELFYFLTDLMDLWEYSTIGS